MKFLILEGDRDNKKQTKNEVSIISRNGKLLNEKNKQSERIEFYRCFVK